MYSDRLKLAIIFLVFFYLFCSSERGTKNRSRPENSNPNVEKISPMADDNDEIRNMTGTIVYNEIEGGFYGIKSDDGKKYNPINLDAPFRKDGLRVKFDANPKKGMVGIHMWGEYVEIIHIETLDESPQSPREDK
jgi:hypothetical protein